MMGHFDVTEEDHDLIKYDWENKYCYHCGLKSIYLFEDGRCSKCTLLTPEEVQGAGALG